MHPDNLISLKDDMVAFIAGHGMRRLHGYIGEEVPTVVVEDESPDGWKDFVEHAKAAGAAFVTMSEVVLKKSDIEMLMEQLQTGRFPPEIADDLEDVQYLVNHVGKIGYLQLGFAHQGVMFMFETATDWYDNFETLLETVANVNGLMVDDYDADDE